MRTRPHAFGIPWAAVLAAAIPAAAGAQEDPDAAVTGGTVPPGWSVRLDRGDANPRHVRVVAMGDGLHVTLGPAIILYRDADRASGTYRIAATFTQTKPARHPEAYGLFIGGADLQGDGLRYTYFLVRQDGKFLVKRRLGRETPTLVPWREHPAVKPVPEGGSATNELAIAVGPDRVRFYANGTEVAALPRTDVDTDGTYGYRVNHNLDVHLGPIRVERAARGP